jgi:ABC-type lipoprotein release transport system permease subunit
VTTYALVVAVMLGTAAGACWIPAYRASRFQLIEALRDE